MTRTRPDTAAPGAKLPADIWVLVSAAFIVAIGYGIIAPVLPQFAESFGLGVTAATIVVSSFAFFRLISAPAGGRLVNRLGERPVYVTGLLIVATSTFGVALAQSYWQLLLFRALGGLGSTMFTVSAMALIIRLAPPTARARAAGRYATAFLLGNIAGPVVGGLMAGWGMRVPFLVYAAALVAAAAVVYFRLGRNERLLAAEQAAQDQDDHEPADRGLVTDGGDTGTAAEAPAAPQPAPSAAEPTAPAEPAPDRSVMRFREAWRDSAYRAALVSGAAHGWTSMGIRVAIYPLFALHVLGAGAGVSGLALTVFALGNTVAVAAVGRWADRLGRRPFILTGLLIMGVSTIALGFSGSVAVFFVLSAIAGIGAGLLNPSQQAVVADVVGPHRAGGVVLSRYQMAMDTGAIFGPIIAGLLAESLGYSAAFAVSGAAVLLAFGAWLSGRETLPSREDGSQPAQR
ncbi:MFS transporter [Brevibacterium sp. NPDC049920]|uniref:MFS transporter n=1 Tax=Brevibacterium sp. NPDC049920 TaxID=3155279 RepID=UPI0025F1C4AB|nr:MFS transporter [uncultured Brevibacterium sp.]